jgi:hypothetical protein
VEPLSKFCDFFSAAIIFLFLSSCSHSKIKNTTSELEKKGFQKENCFFSQQNSLRVSSEFEKKYNFAPFISCLVGHKTHIQFFDKNYMHYEIKDAYKIPRSKTFFVILDYGIEGGLKEAPLLRSIDDGQTWIEIAKVKKPHFSALIKEIKFSSSLKGSIKFEFEDKEILHHLNLAEGRSSPSL